MAGFTQELLNKLDAAIAKGVTEIRYRDKWIKYRSLKEMLELRSEMRKDLGITCKSGKILVSTNKGLGC